MLSIQSRSTTCSCVRTEYAPQIDGRTKSNAKPISARRVCEVRLIGRPFLVAGRGLRLATKAVGVRSPQNTEANCTPIGHLASSCESHGSPSLKQKEASRLAGPERTALYRRP